MSQIEVILLQRVLKLGQMGDVVRVAAGFARNFLFPRGMAERANKESLARFEQQRVQLEAHNLALKKEARAIAEKLEGLKLRLVKQAGENGLLYGSVRAQDIADAITDMGFTVLRGQVVIEQPIKTLGIHDVRIQLHPEVAATIQLGIALTIEEAEALFIRPESA